MGVRDEKILVMKICVLSSPVELGQEFVKTLGVKIFETEYLKTIGCEFSSIVKQVNNQSIRAQIWLVNSSARFRVTRPQYIRNTFALVFLFDTHDRHSFQSVKQLLKEARKNVIRPISLVPIALVGIQSSTRMIKTEEVKTFVDKYHLRYYEITIDDSQQINQILTDLIRHFIQTYIAVRGRFAHAQVERLIRQVGAPRVSVDAIVQLNMILSDYGKKIATDAIEIAYHSGRKTVKEEDIILAAIEI